MTIIKHFIISVAIVMCSFSQGAKSSGVEVRCEGIRNCSLVFNWLSPDTASERCVTQGFDSKCRLRAGKDYFTTYEEAQLYSARCYFDL